MEQILKLISEYQWWIYGLFGLILLFYLRRAILARRESVRSIFKLEQEQARGRYGRSVVLAGAVLLLMGVVFGVTNFLLPTMNQPPVPTPKATTGPLVVPTLTSTAAPPTVTSTAMATAVRPTRPVKPSDTPDVDATDIPAVAPPACPNPNVRLTSPGLNQVVQGHVPVRGTAGGASFQYYKVEVRPGSNPMNQDWDLVGELHRTPVAGGVLETFNGGAYSPGTYTLRLVVVDQTGNYPEPCRVTITVQH